MKKIILLFPKYILYLLSFLIKRATDIWLISSAHGFRDNCKYFAIYVKNNHPKIKLYWISKNIKEREYVRSLGFNSHTKWSIQGIFISLIGKYYIYDYYVSDINLWTSGNTIKINLWHGVGLKNIERTSSVGPVKKIFYPPKFYKKILYPQHYIKPNLFLSTSPMMTEHFAKSFGVSRDKFIEALYPRCEILLNSRSKITTYIEKYEPDFTQKLLKSISAYSKVYIYMPTFRDKNNDFLEKMRLHIKDINNALKKENALLLLKLHPGTPMKNFDIEQCSNITLIPNTLDVYPILPFTDVLITDYSSIYYDYLLMKDKNIVLFPFDYEEYISLDRDLWLPYDLYCQGTIIRNINQLINLILTNADLVSTNDLTHLKSYFWSFANQKNEDIYKKIVSI